MLSPCQGGVPRSGERVARSMGDTHDRGHPTSLWTSHFLTGSHRAMPDFHRRSLLASTSLAWFFGQNAEAASELAAKADAAPVDPPPPTDADLGSLFPALSQLTENRTFDLSYPSDRFRNVDEFRAAGRAKIFELLGYNPPKVDPAPEILERVECDGYTREKITFATSPHTRVPAYVLIPHGLKGPAPAIVDLHSHGGMFLFGKEKVIDLGTNHPAMTKYHAENYAGRPTASELVNRGFVVISIDAFGFGERRVILDADREKSADRGRLSIEEVVALNRKCAAKESTIAKSMAFAGLTWPGIVFWDDIRTVDYLITRPEVDATRIGCLGISMGGYRAIYLTALDDRIKAGCITGFMSTVGPMLKAHIDTHSWIHFLPGLHRHLDLPDVAALAIPRALLVQQCSQDKLFPLEGMHGAVAKIEKAYTADNHAPKFSGRFYDAPHQFTLPMQEEAFAWLKTHTA